MHTALIKEAPVAGYLLGCDLSRFYIYSGSWNKNHFSSLFSSFIMLCFLWIMWIMIWVFSLKLTVQLWYTVVYLRKTLPNVTKYVKSAYYAVLYTRQLFQYYSHYTMMLLDFARWNAVILYTITYRQIAFPIIMKYIQFIIGRISITC